MIKLSSKTIVSELLNQNESLVPFIYFAGINYVGRGLTVTELCKINGINENFLLSLISVCIEEKQFKPAEFPTYNVLQLAEICQKSYSFILETFNQIKPDIEQISKKIFVKNDLKFYSEIQLNEYILFFKRLIQDIKESSENFTHYTLPHIGLVYELYYSPAFIYKKHDLLKYSIEYYKSNICKLLFLFRQIDDIVNRLSLEVKIDLVDTIRFQEFFRLERFLKVQDHLEERLLKPLVLQMEESIISAIQNKKAQYKQHSHIVLKNENPDIEDILTHREKEVLKFVALGYLNKEIADQLNIALTTVITHRKKIVVKLGIRTIPGLTVYAFTHGIIDKNIIINDD